LQQQIVSKGGETVKQKWTGNLIGRMHNADVTYDELAKEAGCTKSYISMILNGRRNPEGARERLESAFDAIVSRRKSD
jgi:transcriptional regulator with XRE-family HTH domain